MVTEMRKYFDGDFDLTISDILLAHKFSYAANSSYSLYQNGRKISGIVYCLHGSAVYRFKNECLQLNPGRMLFLPKDSAYTVENQTDGAFSHITVNFEISGRNFEDRSYEAVADTFGAEELLKKLLNVWTEKKQGYRLMAKSLLYELLYKYFRNIEKNHRGRDYGKILPAKRTLDERYRENIPVSVLAAGCGFSETHFRRVFLRVFLCSPTEYRLKKRITLAKELLAAGELTIAETAAYVGFDDSSYFSRVFKAETGCTPSEYAKREKR